MISRSRPRLPCRRHGISVLWLLLVLPLAAGMTLSVVEIGNLWIARAELENALEAATLAAAREWGEQGAEGDDVDLAAAVGIDFAGFNTVAGDPVTIVHLAHVENDGSLAYSPSEMQQTNLFFGGMPKSGERIFRTSVTSPRDSAQYPAAWSGAQSRQHASGWLDSFRFSPGDRRV